MFELNFLLLPKTHVKHISIIIFNNKDLEFAISEYGRSGSGRQLAPLVQYSLFFSTID
jgi:hypothetical protein